MSVDKSLYCLLLESAKDGIIMLDSNGFILESNQLATKILAIPKTIFLGKNIETLFSKRIDTLLSEFSNHKKGTLTTAIKNRDTVSVIARLDDSLIHENRVLLFISKTIHLQEENKILKRLNDRFFLSQFSKTMIVADTNRALEYTWIYNPQIGFNQDDALGKKVDEIVKNEGTLALLQLKREVLDKEISIVREITFPLSDGGRTWQFEGMPLKDESGKIIGVTTVSIEVTGLIRMQKILEEQVAFIEQILNTNPYAQYIVDMGTMNVRHITKTKRDSIFKLETYHNINVIASQIHPDDREQSKEHIANLFSDTQNEVYELLVRIKLPTNEWRSVQFRDMVIKRDEEGVPIEYLGNAIDVTEKQQAKSAEIEAIIIGQENERSRIAADLHDSINPLLAAAKINLESVSELIDKGNLEKINSLLEDAIVGIREIYSNISPNVLADFGLENALHAHCERMLLDDHSDIQMDIHLEKDRFDFKIELALYRIAQEVLNNVSKHAHATQIELQLIQHQESVTMIIIDNGKGFDQNSDGFKTNGFGFRNIKARVLSLQGKLLIDSALGKGTTITIELPIQDC